ncbi:MAG: DUF790 family protein [Myxococcales bacterium]|nr:DUF790 family protein [Myxococcales bacterium]
MLTADLVRARRAKGELRLLALDAKARAGALDSAAALIAVAEAHVGERRDAFDEACAAVVAAALEPRLAAGLAKLIEDRAEFDVDATADPVELRRDVFERAAVARAALGPGERFGREAVLAAAAAARGVDVDAVERGLFADLRGAHVLVRFATLTPAALVEAYEQGQAQAVLLRAVAVVVEVECAGPAAYRALFRQLKFQRLLHTITPGAKGGYRIEIDGPFSLFEASTRYGLALALALPAIQACDRWKLEAEIRWGPARTPLRWKHEGARAGADDARADLADEVVALVDAVTALATPWTVAPAEAVLDLPGVGLCAPDLAFTHRDTGVCVYLEVLGYWSRDAVWRRVELIERGLPARVVFAVGQHLRVSEAALDGELPGALYVYKRTLVAKAVLERVEAVAAVPVVAPPPPPPTKAAAPPRARRTPRAT